MNPLKISGIFLIATAILIGSWFVFKPSVTVPFSAQKDSSKKNFWGNNDKNPLSNLNLDNLKQLLSGQLSTTSTENQNLTELIGKEMTSKILGASSDLLNYKSGELSPEQQQISNALTSQLKNKNYLPLNQPIDEKLLKIDGSGSVSIKKQYVEAIGNINQKCFNNFNKNAADVLKDAFEKGDTSSSKKLSEKYECVFNDLINTVVPSNWVSFQKDLLIHYQNAKIVYRVISEYQNDPVKASFALNAIKELINSAERIQTMFEIKAKSIGL